MPYKESMKNPNKSIHEIMIQHIPVNFALQVYYITLHDDKLAHLWIANTRQSGISNMQSISTNLLHL